MSVNEKLMEIYYYSPNQQYTSIKKLYDLLKHRGITYDEVKEYIQKQESHQLFKKQKRIKNYFPIVAKHTNEIWQIDIIDMSDISVANENYKYIIACIDVFSRFVWAIPIKNKNTHTIIECMEEIFEITTPEIINCDNGSEFTSREFKKLLSEYNIDVKYVTVGDHHKLGVIDRFIRTLRQKINMYLESHNTTKYINVLPNIIHSYNNSYHSTIKKKPVEVEEEDEGVEQIYNRKYNKAKLEEIIYDVGDKVRYIINLTAFQKGTLPRWSKMIHTIISKTPHTYTLDNHKVYKYYELQKVNDVQKHEKEFILPTREEMIKSNKNKRKFEREGLDMNDIIDNKRRMLRVRK